MILGNSVIDQLCDIYPFFSFYLFVYLFHLSDPASGLPAVWRTPVNLEKGGPKIMTWVESYMRKPPITKLAPGTALTLKDLWWIAKLDVRRDGLAYYSKYPTGGLIHQYVLTHRVWLGKLQEFLDGCCRQTKSSSCGGYTFVMVSRIPSEKKEV